MLLISIIMPSLRDDAFHKNLLRLLDRTQKKAAIVLTGGFHADGFKQNLEKEGISYVVATPKMNSLEGHQYYKDIMQGKLSYGDYFETSLYDAFVRHSTRSLVNELNEPDFRRVLKLWRDNVIRKLAEENRIEETGDYTRYIDLLFRVYSEKFAEGEIREASQEEVLQAVEKELQDYRHNHMDRFKKNFKNQLNEFVSGVQDLASQDELSKQNVRHLLHDIRTSVPRAVVGHFQPCHFSERSPCSTAFTASSHDNFAGSLQHASE